MKTWIVSVWVILILLSSCGEQEQQKDPNEFIITTADEVNITAVYKETNQTTKAVLLLHMLGKDKRDYNNLSVYLQQNGFSVLAIDFRGHGNSDLDYTTFTEENWQNLILDVEAGVDFLESKGYKRIAVVGASIGANAGLKQAVQDTRIDSLVLLSAGEAYHGINVTAIAPYYDRPVLIVAAMDDKEAAVAATRIYNAMENPYSNLKMYPTGGHGTEMLQSQDGLAATIVTWLQETY
ncbi:alpha/beta fold hydrolase [Candidatus Woesearchaeota archaeon]|nr:alpha/beta fold hydrolase [Candidatus Woesearchaeota archaeon]